MTGRKRKGLLLAALLLVMLLCLTYAGLAVEKAISYTTTPAQPPFNQSPSDLGLRYSDIEFPSAASDHLRLSGWWIPNAASRRVVVLVHGRYANRTSVLFMAKPLWDQGFNVLLFDLRGHGESARAFCTYGLKEQWDVVGAVDWLTQHGFTRGSIGVMGWSLGGASALMAMSRSDAIQAVVSDSAYANADPLLARNALRPGLSLAMRLVRGIDLSQVSPERAVARLDDRRIYLIQGTADRAVPPSQAERLARAGGANVAALWLVPGAGHVGVYQQEPAEYVRRVVAFFKAELAG